VLSLKKCTYECIPRLHFRSLITGFAGIHRASPTADFIVLVLLTNTTAMVHLLYNAIGYMVHLSILKRSLEEDNYNIICYRMVIGRKS